LRKSKLCDCIVKLLEEPFNQGKRTEPIPKFSHPRLGMKPNICDGIGDREHGEQTKHKLKSLHPATSFQPSIQAIWRSDETFSDGVFGGTGTSGCKGSVPEITEKHNRKSSIDRAKHPTAMT
jgi:hypothetical protein